jgi:hypothetical protein
MPALNGQIISTITDDTGKAVVTVTWFYDPATGALRNNPVAWTAPSGKVWAIGSGAIIADNQLGRQVRCVVNDETGAMVRRVTIPPSGRAATAAQLAAAPPPDGPYTTMQDLNGLTFDLS